MNTANLPPASVLRPELRARLERLEHLERRERQSRYARWYTPVPVEREPEGWLLTYLDLITLLLVMLVVMLAFSQPKTTLAGATAVATLEKPVVSGEESRPQAEPVAADSVSVVQAATSSPASSDEAINTAAPGSPDSPDTAHEHPTTAPATENGPSPAPLAESGMPSGPDVELPVAVQDMTAGQHTTALLPDEADDAGGSHPAHAADRPAPVDVALVGSVRSSQALQAALPFNFDLGGTATGSNAGTPSGPADVAPGQAESSVDAKAAPAETSGEAGSQASAKPSIEDLGLNELGDNIDVIVNEESVSFRINNEILFTSGQADLMPSGLEVLTRLAEVLARNDYQIAVEGHTDPVPIQNDRFPSNWELSTGRATSVLRHLQSQGIPASRLRATGYADTRPIAPNDSPAGRAFNRRVELIMEMPRGARKSPQSSSSDSAARPLSLSGSASTGPIVRLR